jgi:hypothetical protein
MSRRRRGSLGRITASACAAAAVALGATTARAEYVENYMARDFAVVTLVAAGSVSLGFDIVSTVYVASGPGDEAGRVVTGVGSIVSGLHLVAGAALALSIGGEENVPGGDENTGEYRALVTTRALSGVCFGLGALSVGLGVVTLATFDGNASPNGDEALTWRLVAVPVADGGGVGIAGRF